MGAELLTEGGVAPVGAAAPPQSAQAASNGPSAQPPPAYAGPAPGQHAPPPVHGQTPPTYGQPVYGQYPPEAPYIMTPEPVIGLPIRPPLVDPLPGQVIVG